HHIRLGTLTKKQSTTRPRKHRQAATQGKKRTRQSQRLTRSRITHTTRNRWPKRIRHRNRYHLPALYGNPERMARQITQCPPATHRRTHFSLLNPRTRREQQRKCSNGGSTAKHHCLTAHTRSPDTTFGI